MKKILILILLTQFCFFANAKEAINIVTEEWAPFNYSGDNGETKGITVDIAKELMKITGINGNIEILPWTRAYNRALAKENVMIFTMAKTKDRENKFKWVGKVGERKLYLFKLKSRKDIKIKNIEDVKEYRVGVVIGDAAEKELINKGFIKNVNLDSVVNEETNLKKFFAKRIDFVIGSEYSTAFLCKKLGYLYSDIEKALVIVEAGEYYIAFSDKTSDKIVEKFRKAFEEIQKNGDYSKIVDKYIKE